MDVDLTWYVTCAVDLSPYGHLPRVLDPHTCHLVFGATMWCLKSEKQKHVYMTMTIYQ